MEKLNHEEFKKLVEKIPATTLEDITILLPDSYFKCELSQPIRKKQLQTMFLGLNRSLPNLYKLDYDNMRHPLLGLFEEIDDEDIKEKVIGSYLSDFIKYSILRDFLRKYKYTSSGEIYKTVKGNPKILERCGEVLMKEITVFNIKTVFCFGGATFYFVKKFLKSYYPLKLKRLKPERFFIELNKRKVDFVKLTHYSRQVPNAKEKIKKELKKYFS